MRQLSRSGAALVAILLLHTPCFAPTATAGDSPPCVDRAATIVQLRGRVDLRRAGSKAWARAERHDVLCHGDEIRTSADGRVVWQTPDDNEHRLAHGGHAKFAQSDDKRFILNLLKGLIFVLSRDSRELDIWTRFANGGPEGTEFIVGVNDGGTEFGTLDGAVLVSSSASVRRVNAGETLRVGSDGAVGAAEATAPELLPWAYFPRIVAGPLPLPDAEPAHADDADFFVRRAAARLEVGAVVDALSDLDQAAAVDASDARIDALRAIVAHVAGDQARAEALVASALRASSDSVEALLASSHVRQTADGAPLNAHAAAVRDAQRARDLDPSNGLAWTRLAEAYLAAERYQASADAALEATRVASDSGEAFTVLGFARYAQRRLDDALAAFERAMTLGSMAPHTWHGAALVLWQQGRRDEAREAAEVGLILDPADVDTRSALAKFYNAEARRMLSGEQLALAALLTPNDPTPLLVRSYLDQAAANPIAALLEYRAATQRNAGRPPTRSTFSLDPDLSTEGFGLSRMFIDTDTPALGNVALRKLLADDPLSASAHQLSADLAALEPFNQAVTVNDLWTYTLLMPSIDGSASFQRDQQLSSPVRARMPRVVTTPDTDLPLNEDGIEASISAVAGNRDNDGISTSLAFRENRHALSLGVFDNRSGGYRPNQDSHEQGRSLRFKWARDPTTSAVFDVSSFEAEKGDTVLRFFPDSYGTNLRFTEDNDAVRFGFRRHTAGVGRTRPERRGTLLGSVVLSHYDYGIDFGPFALDAAGKEHSLAVRFVLQTPDNVFDLGASVDLATTKQRTTDMPITTFRDEQRTLYAYLDHKLTELLTLTLGINLDERNGRGFDDSEINGKAALAWEPTERTTLRVAYTETPPPPVASTTRSNGHPDLERTRIAGLSQLVYPNVDRTRTRWTAVDHEFSAKVFGGIVLRERSLSRPFLLNGIEPYFLEIDERVKSAHLYWLASSFVGVAAVHERDKYAAPPGVGDFTDFATRRTTVDVNLFMGGGWSASFRVANVRQDGNFIDAGTELAYTRGDSAFTLFDARLSYRFSNGRTTIDVQADNLGDERFNYQEPEYDFATFARARTVSLAVRHWWR